MNIINWIRYLVMGGNVLLCLWILFNGMDSGWQGTKPEIATFIGLILLLVLNTLLLARHRTAPKAVNGGSETTIKESD